MCFEKRTTIQTPCDAQAFPDRLYSYHDAKTKYVKLLDGGLGDQFGLSGSPSRGCRRGPPHEPLSPIRCGRRSARSSFWSIPGRVAVRRLGVQTVDGPSGPT